MAEFNISKYALRDPKLERELKEAEYTHASRVTKPLITGEIETVGYVYHHPKGIRLAHLDIGLSNKQSLIEAQFDASEKEEFIALLKMHANSKLEKTTRKL